MVCLTKKIFVAKIFKKIFFHVSKILQLKKRRKIIKIKIKIRKSPLKFKKKNFFFNF